MIRILGPGDEAALESFLLPRAESSMFLRGNARAAGLVDRGERQQATYAAAFEDGRIVAVAAHCWNGNVILQAPGRLEEVAAAAVAASLLEARGRGVSKSILFTGEDNEPARRAYVSLGFRIVGDYGIVLFA